MVAFFVFDRLRCVGGGLFPLHPLDDQVADHARAEHGQQHVQFGVDADEVAVRVGDDETDRLPQPVVAKRRLGVVRKDDAVERCNRTPIQIKQSTENRAKSNGAVTTNVTIDLSLPNGIAQSPEGGDDVESGRLRRVRPPDEQADDESQVEQTAEDEDGHAAGLLHQEAAQQRGDGVDGSEADEHEADVLHAPRARNVGLPLRE